jgi:hypothetical protein
MDARPAKSVFISHSSKDDAIVRELCQSLRDLGIETWADSERLSGGDPLLPVIQTEIANADYFLVLVSLNALNSVWVHREIAHAKSLNKRIIPLTVPDIQGPVLQLLFGEEPVAILLDNGTGAIGGALPRILAAIGEQPPAGTIQHVQAQAAPVADLVLELTANAAPSRLPNCPSRRPTIAAPWKASAIDSLHPSALSRPVRSNGISSVSSTGQPSLFWSGRAKSKKTCRNGVGNSITA